MAEVTGSGGKVRLFVEQPLGQGVRIALNPAQSHYLLHVMRARPGDHVSLFNGDDGEWLAAIAEATRRDCVLACERQTQPQAADDDLWLIFAPIKKTPADYVSGGPAASGGATAAAAAAQHPPSCRAMHQPERAPVVEACSF